MITDAATLLARSLLAAAPAPVATRGRYAFVREDRAHQRRLARREQPPATRTPAHPGGPRAARRAEASPAVRPPRLSPAERAFAARHRARLALAACAAREAR